MPTNPALSPLAEKLRRQKGVLAVPRPDRDLVPAWRAFDRFDDWYAFVDALSLNAHTPLKLGERWTRVQTAYLLAWLSPDHLKMPMVDMVVSPILSGPRRSRPRWRSLDRGRSPPRRARPARSRQEVGRAPEASAKDRRP